MAQTSRSQNHRNNIQQQYSFFGKNSLFEQVKLPNNKPKYSSLHQNYLKTQPSQTDINEYENDQQILKTEFAQRESKGLGIDDFNDQNDYQFDINPQNSQFPDQYYQQQISKSNLLIKRNINLIDEYNPNKQIEQKNKLGQNNHMKDQSSVFFNDYDSFLFQNTSECSSKINIKKSLKNYTSQVSGSKQKDKIYHSKKFLAFNLDTNEFLDLRNPPQIQTILSCKELQKCQQISPWKTWFSVKNSLNKQFINAITKNKLSVLQTLFQNPQIAPDLKPDINYKLPHSGWGGIHFVSIGGNTAILLYLIQQGGNINLKSNSNVTPLMLACKYGRYNIVKRLLEFEQLNVNQLDSFENSALHYCGKNQELFICLFIMEERKNNIKLDIKNKNGNTFVQEFKLKQDQDVVQTKIEEIHQYQFKNSIIKIKEYHQTRQNVIYTFAEE